ncbi:MAG: cob(I)yrinic acid a,c-diamide adenosyltransferase [Negativicutes bacterium]|jgi:cob(I)alamin adenosyltransferase
MIKVYTKTGDGGTTRLVDGVVQKDDLRVEAYGTIDEADSVLGLAKINCVHHRTIEIIVLVQLQLKTIMAETASFKGGWFENASVEIEKMEAIIDELSNNLTPLTQLIIPGGKNGSAYLHFARTVVRRAERIAVRLMFANMLDKNVVVYLNRLSDLCFVLARYEDEYYC